VYDLSISVVWSPLNDGYVLSGAEGRLRLLRVGMEAPAFTKLAEYDRQTDRIFVDWSPDGNSALSGCRDVRLLSVSRDPPALTERAIYSGHVGSVYSVAWSSDGKYALTAGEDSSVRLLGVDVDAGTLTELAVFRGHTLKAYQASWVDAKTAWTAGQDGTARWLAIETAPPSIRELARITEEEAVTVVGPSPRGDRLLVGTWGACNVVELWALDANTHTTRLLEVFRGHAPLVRAFAWRADEKRALSGGHNDTVRYFDVTESGLENTATLDGYALGVHALALSADGTRLLVAASHADRLTLLDVGSCP
jgi:WD40 repeat protein